MALAARIFLLNLVACSFVLRGALGFQSPGVEKHPTNSAASGREHVPAADTTGGQVGSEILQNPIGDALSLFWKGDFDAATTKYLGIIAERPKSPDAYAGLVRLYLKKHDVSQASATVEKALKVADSAPVRVALGEVYFRQGKISEAEHEWVEVLNSGHQNARAYLGLARVRWALSLNKSAWTMIEKARQLDAKDPEIQHLWAMRLSRAERIRHLEEYLGGENNEDQDTRASLGHYLDYLKARAADPHPCQLMTKRTDPISTPLAFLFSSPGVLRGFGLSTDINSENAKLLLATSSSGITISRPLAEKAGIKEISETRISGIGDQGTNKGYVGLASSLKVAGLEFKDCPVRVIDAPSVIGVEGFIGADMFSAFLIDLDFAHANLHLSPLPPRPGDQGSGTPLTIEEADDSVPGVAQDRYVAPEMSSYLQIYRFGQDLLVPTRIGKSSDSSKLFVLATDSFYNDISPAAAKEITNVRRRNYDFKGMSGKVNDVYTADKVVLQFGRLRQENQNLVAIDLSKISNAMGTEVSGNLGFTLLQSLEIKIDYRDGLVDFRLAHKNH